MVYIHGILQKIKRDIYMNVYVVYTTKNYYIYDGRRYIYIYIGTYRDRVYTI